MLQATNGLFLLADIWRESGPRTEDEYGTKDEGNKVPSLPRRRPRYEHRSR